MADTPAATPAGSSPAATLAQAIAKAHVAVDAMAAAVSEIEAATSTGQPASMDQLIRQRGGAATTQNG